MHWITVGPADQPETSIVLYPPAAAPGLTDDERRTIAEMMAKGTYASINLATNDIDGTFERLQASDASEVVQEPTDQPYGVRDCAFRDPAGNLIRIQECELKPSAIGWVCPTTSSSPWWRRRAPRTAPRTGQCAHTASGLWYSPTDGNAWPVNENSVRLSLGVPAPGSQPTPGIHSGSQ